MKVAVTGGAGYIGSHIVHDLLDAGHEVVVVDDMSTGSRENVLTGRRGYQFVQGDVTSESGLARLLEGRPEVVFHFAALKAAGVSMKDPESYSRANIRGTLQLIEAMTAAGVKNLVFSSSAAVYGEPVRLPIDETHPRSPINYYGFTKKVIEDNLEWFAQLRGLRYASLRYFNAAGYDVRGRVHGLERNPNNLVPIVMEVAMGIRDSMSIYGTDYETRDGTCIRDYIHVNDLSTAHLAAMDYIVKHGRSLTVNLGSEQGITVKEIVDAARRMTGHPVPAHEGPRRAGDPPVLTSSAALARQMLSWSAKHSNVDTLIQSTWEAYRRAFPGGAA
ncbi:MAG: UDP-glucose 4-epimerase GalE [Spirochaetia bacterium]|nr:UDP-glucose 4-epimerase GalE [Spirochaetia bacterium]